MWEARAEVQVSSREFHTHIHLDYARVEFLSCKKKKKKYLTWCASLKQLPRELISFKHLDNSDCNHLSYMPHELGKMTYLLELSLLIVRALLPFPSALMD